MEMVVYSDWDVQTRAVLVLPIVSAITLFLHGRVSLTAATEQDSQMSLQAVLNWIHKDCVGMCHKSFKSSLVVKSPSQSFSAVTSLGCKEKCMVILQMTLLFMCSLHGTLSSSNEEMFWGSVVATMT